MLEGDVHADFLELALHELSELWDFLQLGEEHRGLETLFARILEQLLGLFDVAGALWLRGIEVRVDRSDWVIVADVALALEDGVDECLTVDAEGNCLTNAHIGEVTFAGVHPHHAVR
ncbi:unannotated protein [freshwater metagenome]|uniref:Unannotated protein n=1 Tax=freshwater metagenome TaxID=449393 RepID=A0A6J6XZU2_9ZZZZ